MFKHHIHSSGDTTELVLTPDPITGPIPLEARSGQKTLLKLLIEQQVEILEHIDITNRALQLVQQNIHHSEAKLDTIISQLELLTDEEGYDTSHSNA